MVRMTKVKLLLIASLLGLSIVPGVTSAEQMSVPVADRDVSQNVSSYLKWNTPVQLELNGRALAAQGTMINSVIMVPLRVIAEAAAVPLSWNASNQSVQIGGKAGKASSLVKAGSDDVTVNDTHYKLDHEAYISGGRLMVSERMLSLALGLELRWDSSDRTLELSSIHGASGMTVITDAFGPGGNIPVKYAHGGVPGGKNISLPVSWDHAPQGTQSYSVVMYDIHPIADNYIHWSVINLPADTTGLPEGAAGSIQTGKELNPYFGMEPPVFSGDHLYRVAVYALDTKQLVVDQTPVFFDQLEPLLKEHMLGYAEVDGFFKQ